MTIDIHYPDTVTIAEVSPGDYGNTKTSTAQAELDVIFVLNTGFNATNFQEEIDSDAICYPDPSNWFIEENYNRLEGMYILAPLFGAGDDASWYRITSVTVYRDHLLNNVIDNIEMRLKKSRPVSGVS